MRIISGKFRGKKITAPAVLPVRPTTDFAKTGLFNILSNHFDFSKAHVLDLFAGTGNISYEFVSRGCHSLTVIDADKRCTGFIDDMKKKLQAPFLRVITADVLRILEKFSGSFDIIFADPPYNFTEDMKLVEGIFRNNLLRENGLFILEHSEKKDLSELENFIEKRKYGAAAFSFFGKPHENNC